MKMEAIPEASVALSFMLEAVRLLDEPTLRTAAENLGEPDRHFRRNATLAVHEF